MLPILASSNGRTTRSGRWVEGRSTMGVTSGVIIGMDPHKRSATIEVLDERHQVIGGGR